jgi:hypothetical protein
MLEYHMFFVVVNLSKWTDNQPSLDKATKFHTHVTVISTSTLQGKKGHLMGSSFLYFRLCPLEFFVKHDMEIFIKSHGATVISNRVDPQERLHYIWPQINCFKCVTNV